jgi:aminopeptidase N
MTAPDRYVPHRGDTRYRVTRYELDLDYRPSTNALVGRALLTVEPRVLLDTLDLDLVGLGVDDVRVAGRRPARYRHRGSRLTVTLGSPAPAGAPLLVQVRYSGSPAPQRGPWGEVGWEELTDGVLVAGQPDGAPTWFPCNDHPADKATYRTTVRTESGYSVVANGVLVSQQQGSSRTTWVYEQAEPMATYLATVQIGRYDEHVLARVPVPQLLLAPTRLRERALADTARSPEMLALFTRLFGPYPFAGYTVVVTDDDLEIPLEAQGVSVFGANHVDGAGGSERLVAHELAHQWFGNSLTAAAWQDVWLHEGFACYAEWLWSEASGGPVSDVLAATTWQRLKGMPQDLLLSDPGPQDMFDDRLYKRGALALHALRRDCGDAAFFALLRTWVQEHRHGAVSTPGFLAHVAAHAGTPAAARLRAWLAQRPLPALSG